MMRGSVAGVGLLVLACSPNSGSLGTGSVGRPMDGGSMTTDATEGATSMEDTVGADGVGTGTGGSDPTMPATGGSDPTMPADGTGDGPMTTTGDEGPAESSGEPPPVREMLENHDFVGCDLPMWCFSGNISNPWGQEQWMQECFQATLAPPFELTELEVDIWDLGGTFNEVRVEVYANTGAAGPGALLEQQSIPPASLSPGLNTITLNPPMVINQQNICLGIASPNPQAALGVAVNESSLVNDASYFRLDSASGCDYFNWTDIIDEGTIPTGNWCIRGMIETQ